MMIDKTVILTCFTGIVLFSFFIMLIIKLRSNKKMKAKFYDVKKKESVERPVIEKVTYGEGTRIRYALKGKTEDGRNLTAFCSKEVFDSIKVK